MFIKRLPSTLSLAAVFATCIALSSSASARENSAAERASAESLFQDGRRLMEAEEYDKASQAFEASQELDPGAGTLLNLARAYELAGKVASAWSTFAEVEGLAQRNGDTSRSEIARRHRERIEPLVPYVIIAIEGLSDDAQIKLDKKRLSHRALKLKLATDPGEHTLEVTQQGKAKIERTFQVPQVTSDQNSIVSISLGPAPALGTETSVPAKEHHAPSLPGAAPPLADTNEEPRFPWKTTGIVTTIVGGVGVGLGTALAFQAYDKAAKADCINDECSPEGLQDRAAAISSLPPAYAIGISGAVLFTAGLVLSFQPSDSQKTGLKLRTNLASGLPYLEVLGRF